MNWRLVLLGWGVLGLVGLLPAVSHAAESDRPNVLFIISDDLNNYLGCYEDPRAKTPHLDKLAKRGVRFDRAYCAFPLCGPGRNAMLTGLHANSTGIYDNQQLFRQTIPKHHSLPQAFRLAGYFAARVGKLYHYNVPTSVGTAGHEDPGSWELQINPAGVDRLEEESKIFSLVPGSFGATPSWYASPKPDEEHTDGMLATDATWILERCAQRKDRPFFLAVGFYRPHTPYVAPKDPYFDQYDLADMPFVEDVQALQKNAPPAAYATGYRVFDQETFNEQRQRECAQAYYASISFMDAQVGRIVDVLDEQGLADNTIIVFTSDHGYHIGEHGLWQKRTLFEEGTRVPLMIVAPGITKPGGVVTEPVSHLDLYPTLAELCEVETPSNLHGQSLVAQLKDPAAKGRGWALSQITRGPRNRPDERYFGYSLRTAKWRYNEWDGGAKGRELYDHENDPQEQQNLVEDPAHAETVNELSQQLRAAVQASFPPSGEAPKLRSQPWAPNLTNP